MSGSTLETIRSEIIDDLSSWLRSRYHGAPTGSAGTADQGDLQLRLGAALYVLVRLHRIDYRGRCRLCRAGHPRRHLSIRLPARKVPCRVLKIAAFFTTASAEEVWLRVLPSLGIRRDLNAIRAHLTPRSPILTQVDQHGRHTLNEPETR
jgi:hypothetical protein